MPSPTYPLLDSAIARILSAPLPPAGAPRAHRMIMLQARRHLAGGRLSRRQAETQVLYYLLCGVFVKTCGNAWP